MGHLLPLRNYRDEKAQEGLVRAEQAFIERDRLDTFMVLFGVGDGGGGPTAEQIERGIRMRNLEGCPRVTFARADDIFEYFETERAQLEVWQGELYLELHRGTLTTQAANKRNNRKLEFELQAIEALAVSLAFDAYPQQALERVWKNTLLNQFHDIIPGSSIKKVYDTTSVEYAHSFATLAQLRNDIVAACMQDDRDSALVYNPWNFAYTTHIQLPAAWHGYAVTTPAGAVATQLADGIVWGEVHLRAGMWCSIVRGKPVSVASQQATHPSDTDYILENEYVRYRFNASGRISEAFDKELQRSVLRDEGNVLTIYEDRPANWDAWDIDIYYRDAVVETLHADSLTLRTAGDATPRAGDRLSLW